MYPVVKYCVLLIVLISVVVNSCLITNCPRGGKRNGPDRIINEQFIKQCISCGPQRAGQCFGPSICCGSFGCLVGTPETVRCARDGGFHEPEPCIAGQGSCRGDSGRCAADGICCTQESCHADPTCVYDEERRDRGHNGRPTIPIESIFNVLNPYRS